MTETDLQQSSKQQTDSCSNWFTRYKYIDSTETITKGIFSRIEENKSTKETKIILTSGNTQYYVLFENGITKVTIINSMGKEMPITDLKKGDSLKIVEGYKKLVNNKESFSVTVTKEKL